MEVTMYTDNKKKRQWELLAPVEKPSDHRPLVSKNITILQMNDSLFSFKKNTHHSMSNSTTDFNLKISEITRIILKK